MSTTRSQKRKNNQQESTESVSEVFVSPIVVDNSCPLEQDVSVAGPSRPKSPRSEISLLESLRASLKEKFFFRNQEFAGRIPEGDVEAFET